MNDYMIICLEKGRYQISVSILVMCDASDVIQYD